MQNPEGKVSASFPPRKLEDLQINFNSGNKRSTLFVSNKDVWKLAGVLAAILREKDIECRVVETDLTDKEM